ncbi:unnamed protein product [Cyclocybe aegerita]|uniref:Uncharacterized protein n=1 Tax=Cyclocybe aegerita TaxID=1973307 RepID=A0A8S0XYV8_CYCAE|nr:unnamed protein product [Cyclocybe aegerita]
MARPPYRQITPSLSSEFSDIVLKSNSQDLIQTQTSNPYSTQPSSQNRSRNGSVSLSTPARPMSIKNPSPLSVYEWTPSPSKAQDDGSNMPLLFSDGEADAGLAKAKPPQTAGLKYSHSDPFGDQLNGRYTIVLDDPEPTPE